jgi:hypothetical protein
MILVTAAETIFRCIDAGPTEIALAPLFTKLGFLALKPAPQLTTIL